MGALPPLGRAYPLAPVSPKAVYKQLQPRFVVKLNGQVFLGKSYELELNAHGDADTATIVLPIKTYPDWSALFNATSLGPDSPVYVEIWAGFPPQGWAGNTTAQLTRRFYGLLDTGAFCHESDETTLTCRSLAAPLLTTKITTPFTGQNATTTVAFIQQQAARFGLTANIQLNPNSPAATMQQVLASEFVTGVRNWSIWQLMLQCAQMDDVDLWVDSQGVLNYCAPAQVQRSTYSYAWLSNISKFTATHALQFSKNIRVEVRSWVKRTRVSSVTRVESTVDDDTATVQQFVRTVTSTPIFGTLSSVTQTVSPTGTTIAQSTSSGGAASSGFLTPGSDSGLEIYVVYAHNKTPQQCNDLALKIWRQITQHEWMIDMEAPVTPTDLGMNITALLSVSGSPFSEVNQRYWPRQIREIYHPAQGFYRQYTAVNHQNPLGSTSV